jgi:hypothetical protein
MNYDELRRAVARQLATDTHLGLVSTVRVRTEDYLALLDENAALRAALVRISEIHDYEDAYAVSYWIASKALGDAS